MFDLLANGQIGIDFTMDDGTIRHVTVNPPPTVGAYKRLKRKEAEIDQASREWAAGLDKEPEDKPAGKDDATDDSDGSVMTAVEKRAAILERNSTSAIEWWLFALIGDDTWKGLAPDVPTDTDQWPIYMGTAESIGWAEMHWRSVPLARGGKLELGTN